MQLCYVQHLYLDLVRQYKLIIIYLFSIFSIEAQIENIINNLTNQDTHIISEEEISNGIKDALNIGVSKSCESASSIDGFLKNELIKIKFPEEAKKVKKSLKKIGLENQINEFVISMNRAAEDATKEASNILLEAIRTMSIQDAVKILNGENNAATNYLYAESSEEFKKTFKPIIDKSISNNQVAKNWNKIIKVYNKIPMTENINPDIKNYVLEKTIEGIFTLIAQEEKKIRENPENRVTELLQKVFDI